MSEMIRELESQVQDLEDEIETLKQENFALQTKLFARGFQIEIQELKVERDRLAAELEVEEKRFNDLTDDYARLAAENAELVNALERMVRTYSGSVRMNIQNQVDVAARAALAKYKEVLK